MKLEGKVVLITGGAKGLGKAYGQAALERKAKTVVITDVLDEVGEVTAKEFQSRYGEQSAIYRHGDVTDAKAMREMFTEVVTTCGCVDVIINNAGIIGDIDATIDINFRGVVYCTEMAIEHMRTDQGGRGGIILNVASLAAVTHSGIIPVYHGSKAAVYGYTFARGLEIGDATGIKFRCLCPASVLTDMTQEILEAGDKEARDFFQNKAIWIEMSSVVDTCMKLIERDDLPQNTAAVVNPEGSFLADVAKAPWVPFI